MFDGSPQVRRSTSQPPTKGKGEAHKAIVEMGAMPARTMVH